MRSTSHHRRLRPLVGLAFCQLAFCLLLSTGCSSGNFNQYINDYYGYRSGYGSDSVNGTGVLAEMFANQGHRVRSATSLYPRVGKADVIVWFSQDWNAPSGEARTWFDNWLRYNDEGDPKTLIYVCRDYSAAEMYWTVTKPSAPANQQGEYSKRLTEARTQFNSWRGSAPTTDETIDWLTMDRRNTKTKAKRLSGPWSVGVDASKTTIEHRAYLTPAPDASTLLADQQGHPLVSEIVYTPEEWDWRVEDSRLLMVENGSFLLNAPLVNKEHRKIAGKLIDHVGSPELDVVFLESGYDPMILKSDPSDSPPPGWKLFTIWPIGGTLSQLAALGLVFSAAMWPIFGTPRRSERPSLTDFGRHVAALGRLLAATRDRAYAEKQLRTYFHQSNERN